MEGQVSISTLRFVRAKLQATAQRLNPLHWPTRAIKVVTTAFFAIALPIYVFIGLQPAPVDAANLPALTIPSIELATPVQPVELTDHQLIAPATIAGIYQPHATKLFIFGHSSTVFTNLHHATIGSTITYDNATYTITSTDTLAKSAINMAELLRPETEPTLILMTCAGTPLPGQDATHRLIITAKAVGPLE